MKLKNKLLTFYFLLFVSCFLFFTGCVKRDPTPPIVTPQKDWGMVKIAKTYGIADAFDRYPHGGELEESGWAGDCNDDPAYLTSSSALAPHYHRDYTTGHMLVIGVDQRGSCKFTTIGVVAYDFDGDPTDLTCSIHPRDENKEYAGIVEGPHSLYPIPAGQPHRMGCRYKWYPIDRATEKPIKGNFTIEIVVSDKDGNTDRRTFYVKVQENYK